MNALANQFGPDNLPFCMFGEVPRPGIRTGEFLVDLVALEPATPRTLTALFAEGRLAALALRDRVRKRIELGHELPLLPAEAQPLHLPFAIPNFVDFYSSREHATNVGRLFRDAANPLPENWLHLPAAYNGRASNVMPGGCAVVRPRGQYKTAQGELVFASTEQLDYEVEMGVFLCPAAEDRLAGFVMLNDWSARDMQRWEYVPLGPFLSKGFATTVSPYLVVPEALAARRCAGPLQEPRPLLHLQVNEPRNLDIALEASVIPAGQASETLLTQTNYRHIYWSHQQQLVHLLSADIRLSTGDLLGSGTISGPLAGSEGSLLERKGPFLQDGDTVIFRAHAGSIGFGELRSTIHAHPSC